LTDERQLELTRWVMDLPGTSDIDDPTRATLYVDEEDQPRIMVRDVDGNPRDFLVASVFMDANRGAWEAEDVEYIVAEARALAGTPVR
jgi:hypothetical protein